MRDLKKLILALALLVAGNGSAFAYWTDDYMIGDSYSGLVDIAPFGARKHVVLPPSEGKWILVSIKDFYGTATQRGNSFVAPASVKMSRLVFAEVIDEKVVSVLEATASHLATGASWPEMCFASEKYLFRDNFPRIGKGLRKCLVLEMVAPSSVADLTKNPVVNFSPKPSSKVIKATATVQGRDGFLEMKITGIQNSDLNQSAFEEAYVQWAQKYSDLLEASLSHSADKVANRLTGVPHQLADGSIVEHADGKGKTVGTSPDEILRSIEKLKDFKDNGILSEEEFKAKKDELLKRL